MKLIVETTGPFSLQDSLDGQYIDMNRPAVAIGSVFVQKQIGRGQLRTIGQVNDEATDLEFFEHWNACADEDTGEIIKALAVESFISRFPVDTSEPPVKAKPKAKSKPAPEE